MNFAMVMPRPAKLANIAHHLNGDISQLPVGHPGTSLTAAPIGDVVLATTSLGVISSAESG